MTIDDWKRIEIDCVIRIEGDSPLFRIEIACAQKTRAFRNRLAVHRGGCTPHPMRNVPDKDIEPIDPYRSGLGMCKAIDAPLQSCPGDDLLREQIFQRFNHCS